MRRLVLVGCIAFALFAAYLWFTLPDVSDPRSFLASQSTVITDRNGIELYRLFQEEDRTFVSGDKIPKHMKQAIVSIEDERYYERGCLDLRAIGRAVIKLGRAGGGSTVTRQLARNALDLRKENRYLRKVKELILGCQLESRFEKEELLELYLNWIPFGRNAYGIEQASKEYFNASAEDLSLAQAVVLASLPQRPTYFSPYGRNVHTSVSGEITQRIVDGEITTLSQIPGENIRIGLLGAYAGSGGSLVYVGGRTDQVLRNMQDQGYITDEERKEALSELELIEFNSAREDIRAPHFVLWVREQVEALFAESAEEGLLEQGGLRIETTLDWELQQIAEKAVERYREDINDRFGAQNMSVVALDPETSAVVAYVGNMDYSDTENGGKIDMAQAPRQPGSSFKPFVYAAAFKKGYQPATPLWDVETLIGEDEPQNFDGKFVGLTTIRQALGSSRNLPAAKAYFLAGQENPILTLMSALGAPTPLERKKELQKERGEFDYGWPLALGAAETPLLEMVSAYGALARGGNALPTVSIRRVTDKKGNLLYEAQEEEENQVIDERIAYQISSILSDESVRPDEYWKTQLTVPGFQTAAKTGTSNKCLEWDEVPLEDQPTKKIKVCKLRKPDNAWLLGYTPNLVTGVWVGNADSASMFETAGGLNTASPIWRDFMAGAHRKITNPKAQFEVPEGIVSVQVSTLSGQLPTTCTPLTHRKADVFLKEFAPSQPDPFCGQLTIDKVTRLLASEECPADAQESGSFLVAKSLLPERWPTWEEGVQKWVGQQMELWYATDNHSGAVIPLPVAPTEKCTLALTPGRAEKPTVTITSPSPGGTATYPTFKPRLNIESKAGIHEVSYRIDSKKVATVSSPPFTQTLRVPRSIKEAGHHTLSVEVVDEYFNKATARINFTFEEDVTPPTVEFVLPRGDIRLPKGGTLRMKANAEDSEGGLKYVQFYIGDVLLSNKPVAPFELNYDITQEPGVYSLRAKATDFSGNSSEDVLTLTVD